MFYQTKMQIRVIRAWGAAVCAVWGRASSLHSHLVLSKDRSEERKQGQDFLPLLSSAQAAAQQAFLEGLAGGFSSSGP